MGKSIIEKYKSFEKWKAQEVEREFGVKRLFDEPFFLTDFLNNPLTINEIEKEKIEELRAQLNIMSDVWNEYDMSILFIGPLFNVIKSQQIEYRTFFNHTIKATIKNKEITGRIDGMLAKGRQIPEVPLFFIQEYKPESGPNGDPIGQLLVEMVTCQTLNDSFDEPLYGCYIIGRNWHFMVLQGNEYAVSNAYNASNESVFTIVGLLKKVKMLFEEKIGM
jgi:hypothetical protein